MCILFSFEFAPVNLDHGLQVKVASGILTTLNSLLDELVWTSMFSSQVLQHRHLIFMSSSTVMMFWLHCHHCRHVILYVVVASIILWSFWVVQLGWRPFLGSESEHNVPTTFLEPAMAPSTSTLGAPFTSNMSPFIDNPSPGLASQRSAASMSAASMCQR